MPDFPDRSLAFPLKLICSKLLRDAPHKVFLRQVQPFQRRSRTIPRFPAALTKFVNSNHDDYA